MNKATTVFASGKLYWAKIVGDRALHPTYDGDAREWSYEFVPNDVSFLKEFKLLDRLKDKEDVKNPDKGDYLVLRKPELNYDGEKNDPIRIYDENNEPWPEDKLIGNGSEADVKLRIIERGRGKKSSIYTTAIRITNLVPYVSNEFGAMDGDDDEAEKPRKKKADSKPKGGFDDLDDDAPFE